MIFSYKYFAYSTPSNYYLKALPVISKEYEKLAEEITARFVGDASFFAYNGEEAEEIDPDAPPVERFRELHRLSYVVRVCINQFNYDSYLLNQSRNY